MEGKYHVVGYHLAISPKNYEIEFQKSESQFLMISTFDISRKDGCCIPFCCLFPRCERWKEVIDTFTFQNNKLTLQSSTAFGGLITCLEKGKIFHILWVDFFLILVNEKEIFVLSKELQTPTDQERMDISASIARINYSAALLPIKYL